MTDAHIVVCPNHGQVELEDWQEEDGPCADGRWYCVVCIEENRCGCTQHGDWGDQ